MIICKKKKKIQMNEWAEQQRDASARHPLAELPLYLLARANQELRRNPMHFHYPSNCAKPTKYCNKKVAAEIKKKTKKTKLRKSPILKYRSNVLQSHQTCWHRGMSQKWHGNAFSYSHVTERHVTGSLQVQNGALCPDGRGDGLFCFIFF